MIYRSAANPGAGNGLSGSTANADESSIAQSDGGSPDAPRSRVKRYLEEPKRTINEPFVDYQKRHFAWRKGLGKMPEDEGKTPPRSAWQVFADVAFSLVTAPGVGTFGEALPKLASLKAFASDADAPSPSTSSSAGSTIAEAGGRVGEMERPGPSATNTVSSSGTSTPSEIDWGEYMREDEPLMEKVSERAESRQKKLYDEAQVPYPRDLGPDDDSSAGSRAPSPSQDNGLDYGMVALYSHESNGYFNNFFRYDGTDGWVSDTNNIGELADVVDTLPKTEGVTLYRGGSGGRGTSGEHFRSGEIRVGDQLVNTEFTSFTENPYIAKDFFGSNVSRTSGGYTYDNTSVVFIVEDPKDAHAVAPLSARTEEAESLYTPGHDFTVTSIDTSEVNGHPLVQVRMAENDAGASSGRKFDLRTGRPFDRDTMEARIGKEYADRFFGRAA